MCHLWGLGYNGCIEPGASVRKMSSSIPIMAMVNPAQNPQNEIFRPRVKASPKSVDPNQLLYAEDLLKYYKFVLDGRTTQEVLQVWAAIYPVEWIRQAIVEALYQGRYKAISVEQILQIWHRRQQAQPHFDDDFEQLIRQRLPQNLNRLDNLEETSAVAELAADIHAQSHIQVEQAEGPRSTLKELTQFVQSRRPRQVGIDAVIDQAEAAVNSTADQAKKTVAHEPSSSSEALSNNHSSKAIEGFIPKTANSDLITKLRRSVSHDSDKTAS